MADNQNSFSHKILKHPVIEGFFTLVAASVAYNEPFNDQKTSLVIAVIGVLFGIGRYGIMEVLKEERKSQELAIADKFKTVEQLAKFVDLSRSASFSKLREINECYSKIADPEFLEAKDELLSDVIAKLNSISFEKRTAELSTGAYYAYLLDLLSNVKHNEIVYAVSTGEDLEWDDSPEEEKFFNANVDITLKGGKVIRYFVFEKEDFEKAKRANSKVSAHFKGSQLIGRFVDKENLKKKDERLYNAIGQGFLMIGQRIAVVDVFGSQPRGYITKNTDEIDRYWKAVKQLEKLSAM